MNKGSLALVTVVFLITSLACSVGDVLADSEPQGTRIELSLEHQVLRDEIMIITGRLSTAIADHPIPLVRVRFQYYRMEDTDFTREVVVFTSNPGGLFEDRFNTTTLLRIGTWLVNASFSSQLGYESTWAIESFTIMVQPALSLYLSSHSVRLGDSISFDGLLFACIPCIRDEVTVVFSRPDNSSVSKSLIVRPTGGPYPGGYYNGTFTPDIQGKWRIRAIWEGNDASLPALSTIQELEVESPTVRQEFRPELYYLVVAGIVGGGVLIGLHLNRSERKPTRRSRLSAPADAPAF